MLWPSMRCGEQQQQAVKACLVCKAVIGVGRELRRLATSLQPLPHPQPTSSPIGWH
jgi:hypothetical protein